MQVNETANRCRRSTGRTWFTFGNLRLAVHRDSGRIVGNPEV